MFWQEKLEILIKKGCTDSDIEDFISAHTNIKGKDIWEYIYEYDSPVECKGCKHIQKSGTLPCIMCSRKVKTKDFYESR